jgi:uncharacterized protein (DUF2147 family)
MTKTLLTPAIALALATAAGAALAQATPVGLWKTIDDETKIEKSLVRITEQGGAVTARIEKLLDPKVRPDALCDKCTDERKDKPLVGMVILRNARPDADKEVWEGGEILDPHNGKTFRARLKPLEGGKRLEMRGYLGFLYRTQHWIRIE